MSTEWETCKATYFTADYAPPEPTQCTEYSNGFLIDWASHG